MGVENRECGASAADERILRMAFHKSGIRLRILESDCGFLKSIMSIIAIILVLVAGRLLFKGDMIGNMRMNDGWSAVMSAILLVLFIAECFLDGVTMWGWIIILPYCLLDIGAWTIRKETGL